MKNLTKLAAIKIFAIVNIIFFVLVAVSKGLNSLMAVIAQIPIAGKPIAAILKVVFTPITAAAKFSKVVIVVDVILLVLLLIVAFLKKRSQKKVLKEVSEETGAKESTLLETIKAFK